MLVVPLTYNLMIGRWGYNRAYISFKAPAYRYDGYSMAGA
ncbi:hypothetical protein ASZ90_019612 [hydrocarbon metagenome]|uniref:Uncharacterized protein n=1 Tax=hydrocarbon metagenome TaxID=938273 RepID=A0A0W8E2W3_9ZZZZ